MGIFMLVFGVLLFITSCFLYRKYQHDKRSSSSKFIDENNNLMNMSIKGSEYTAIP